MPPETEREELERLRREVGETPRQELERLRAEQNAFSTAGVGAIGPNGEIRPSLPPRMRGFREGETPQFGLGDFASTAAGVADTGRVAVTSTLTEILGGLAGLTIQPSDTQDTPGAETQQAVRDFFEPLNRPRTETSRMIIGELGETLAPLQTAVTDFADVGADIQRSAEAIGAGHLVPDFLKETPLLSATAQTILLGGPEVMGGRNIIRSTRNAAARRGERIGVGDETPDIEELFNSARTFYREANEMGGGISQNRLDDLADRLENLRSADGAEPMLLDEVAEGTAFRIRQNIVNALREGNVDFDTLSGFRRRLVALADDVGPTGKQTFEGHAGQRMREELDDLVFNLKPGDMAGNATGLSNRLQLARSLWRDASAAAEIRRRIRRAQERSGQFSGSGYENALRTEFRQLMMQIIDRKQRFFTPEEVRLIQQVSSGNQLLRDIGGFAPKSKLNALAGGAGLGGLAFAMGLNPALGLLVPAAGQIARSAATRRGINAANEALQAPLRRSLLDQSQ